MWISLVALLALATPAAAQTEAPPEGRTGSPAVLEPKPGSVLPPREILREKPSGFWTSNKPSQHGAYRWRMLGIGVGILALTGYLTYRALRKASTRRAA
jgi:hypothetical protein